MQQAPNLSDHELRPLQTHHGVADASHMMHHRLVEATDPYRPWMVAQRSRRCPATQTAGDNESTARQTTPIMPKKIFETLRLTLADYPLFATTRSTFAALQNILVVFGEYMAVGQVAKAPEDARIAADQAKAVESSRSPWATAANLEVRGDSVIETLEARHLIHKAMLTCNDKAVANQVSANNDDELAREDS